MVISDSGYATCLTGWTRSHLSQCVALCLRDSIMTRANGLPIVPLLLVAAVRCQSEASWRQLPALPELWAPNELAHFLRLRGYNDAARAVDRSVHVGAFDEIDGPAFLDADDASLAARLSLSTDTVAELKTELRQAEARHALASARPATNGVDLDPAELADRMAGALWGLFIGDALAMPAHWCRTVVFCIGWTTAGGTIF